MKLIICFTLLGFKMVFGSVPDGNWSDWVEKGTALTKVGDHRRAVEAYQKALAQARVSALDALPLARIMSSLAGAYADAGEYASAEFEWRQALTVVKKAEGADSLDYALLAATVGILPTQISARDSVVVLLRRALSIYEGTASARDLAIVRAGLAHILLRQKNYGAAEDVLMDLRIDVARLRRESPGLLAELLNYRGELRFRQRRFQEALDLHRESVNVLLEIPQQGDASIALYLYNVATDLTKMGRLRSALPVYEKALDVCAKSLGEEHPIYGELLKNYSTALRKLGYKREAKLAITRTEEIKRISLRRNGTGLTISAPALSSITR